MVFKLSLVDVSFSERPVRFRMPFRYGVVTLREAPEVQVMVTIRLTDGREQTGVSADLLAPKWFDKNPSLSNEDNFEQLRASLRTARRHYLDQHGLYTPFALHTEAEKAQHVEGGKTGIEGLVSGFGIALIDRAILDACCRAYGQSFFSAIRNNLPGITSDTAPDLEGFGLDAFLKTLEPSRSLGIRHTVGLTDYLRDEDIPEDEWLTDGLPQSLHSNCLRYGYRWLKIKLGGRQDDDLERLRSISRLLDDLPWECRFTLDGNEQFSSADEFMEFWQVAQKDLELKVFLSKVSILEQPIARASALERNLGELGTSLNCEIDESDANIGSFLLARQRGYIGVSSKSCKGVYRSLLNRARVEKWNREDGKARFFMSAEDLSTQAGTALQQDLSLATLIGCDHVERNGHQYGDGLAKLPEHTRRRLGSDHPDIYSEAEPRMLLHIIDGTLAISSLEFEGFGTKHVSAPR